MFRFSKQVWKGVQMGEIMKLLTSVCDHALVKSFSGSNVIQQPFSTGKLFNVSEESGSDLKSLSTLLHRLEDDATLPVIRGSLTDGQNNPVPPNKETLTATPRQWCMIDINSLSWNGDTSDHKQCCLLQSNSFLLSSKHLRVDARTLSFNTASFYTVCVRFWGSLVLQNSIY